MTIIDCGMVADNDKISENGIRKFLNEDTKHLAITVLESTTSTNTYLKELASKGAKEGSVVFAEEQTMGKGRRGRGFFSPQSSGIYMSLLLKPGITADEAVLITALAAVAVCEGIEKLSDKKAEIKWVNDVFINKKKVCGILVESSFSRENVTLEYVVIGIGINVFEPVSGFPQEINDIITALFTDKIADMRNRMAAEVLNRVFAYYKGYATKEFIGEYKKRSLAIGREVEVIEADKRYLATVLDIDEQCRLVVRTEEGEEKSLFSGEISIKL